MTAWTTPGENFFTLWHLIISARHPMAAAASFTSSTAASGNLREGMVWW